MHVTISRRFVARYCHVAFGWLDRNPHEGTFYSGGRLGIAAAVVRVSWAPLLGSFTQLAHSQLLLSRKFKQYAIDSVHDSARHTIPSQFFKKTSPAAQQLSCRNIPSSSEHSVMPTTSRRAPRMKAHCGFHRNCHAAFGWLDSNPREGAIYSGGRLGIAAAVVRVSWAPLLGSFTQLAHSHLLLS
jgi:hypothetical protein